MCPCMSENLPGPEHKPLRARISDDMSRDEREIQDWLNGPSGGVVMSLTMVILVVVMIIVAVTSR